MYISPVSVHQTTNFARFSLTYGASLFFLGLDAAWEFSWGHRQWRWFQGSKMASPERGFSSTRRAFAWHELRSKGGPGGGWMVVPWKRPPKEMWCRSESLNLHVCKVWDVQDSTYCYHSLAQFKWFQKSWCTSLNYFFWRWDMWILQTGKLSGCKSMVPTFWVWGLLKAHKTVMICKQTTSYFAPLLQVSQGFQNCLLNMVLKFVSNKKWANTTK